MEPDFNPSSEEQATDRLHRIGQLRDVHIHKFFIKGTRQELLLICHCRLANAPRDATSSLLVYRRSIPEDTRLRTVYCQKLQMMSWLN